MRPLLFPGDLPIIDKPLPRFLDDTAAAKLLRATRADPDPLSRLIVELLARTGIRRGLPSTAVVEAVIAHSDRPHFGKALVAAPVIRPLMRRSATAVARRLSLRGTSFRAEVLFVV